MHYTVVTNLRQKRCTRFEVYVFFSYIKGDKPPLQDSGWVYLGRQCKHENGRECTEHSANVFTELSLKVSYLSLWRTCDSVQKRDATLITHFACLELNACFLFGWVRRMLQREGNWVRPRMPSHRHAQGSLFCFRWNKNKHFSLFCEQFCTTGRYQLCPAIPLPRCIFALCPVPYSIPFQLSQNPIRHIHRANSL